MSVGFPDYARLEQQGGYLLYGASGVVPLNTTLFQGYVGSWPYINLVTDPTSPADKIQVIMEYFTDATFTTLVAFRYAIRDQLSICQTQYANLSPWLKVFYRTAGNNTINWAELAFYATTGEATSNALSSADEPLLSVNTTVVGGGNFTQEMQHIQPGDCTLMIYTKATTWNAQMQYYSYSNAAQMQLWHGDSTQFPEGSSWSVPMIDAPHTFSFTNSGATTQQLVVAYTSRT